MIDKAKNILKTIFGYDEFISLQENIIENVLRKQDTLAVMPTGGGKSVCYQIPALVFEGLTIVISPLISLMKDQVEQLRELGVNAALLNSSLSNEEYLNNVAAIKNGEAKLLYIAPESMMKESVMVLLSSVKVDLIAIDEAHCISAWGHDFRPEYRQIAEMRQLFPEAGCIALTATATPVVRKDIKAILDFSHSSEFIASFNRENLLLKIQDKKDPLGQVKRLISKYPNESGIIYCATRKQVDDLSFALENHNLSVKPYHAGMPESERNLNQELFSRDDVKIIVATVAFGMGINKSNVRYVIHFDLPQNIENYYQEIGRAGRDGLPSECLLLFSYGDIQKIRYFINNKQGHEQRVAGVHLNTLIQYAESEVCRRIPLLNYFGEEYSKEKCNMCDNCLSEKKEKVDITIEAQKFLSCVKRTGERFGSSHIIDVLRESKSEKVIKFGHDKLSTYGIGKDYSKKQWLQMSRYFLSQGLMIQDMEFGGLSLTPKAWEVFRGSEKVFGQIDEHVETGSPNEFQKNYDEKLFEILRRKRKELAELENVPPFVIFSDKSLAGMATFYPKSEEGFLSVHGVGRAKLEKFGPDFIGIIDEYCAKNNIEENTPALSTKLPPVKKIGKKRQDVVGEAFNSGRSIESLMEEFNVKQATILTHLNNYLREGNKIRTDELVELSSLSEDEQKLIINAFHEHGTFSLKVIKELVPEEISYDELHILRLYYNASEMNG